MDQEQLLCKIADEIRSYGAIAIIGAGASKEVGFPLNAQLQTLLWHAIDTSPALLKRLSHIFNTQASSAKALVGQDNKRQHIAYKELAANNNARRAYQYGFATLNQERIQTPSRTHNAVAELLHRGTIDLVVSFNWDTLLETAYRKRYGILLKAGNHRLYKPHGDAATPESEWVLPHEAGYVPDTLIDHVHALLRERPRSLLIIGYSERDEEVVTKLIQHFSDHLHVVRIGPHASGPFSVSLSAHEALPKLIKRIYSDPEASGWEYVTFENQHDLGTALASRQLGPADVESCPQLPEVKTVLQQLSVTFSVIITGKSGCGKTISAFQAAYTMHKQGWEVLQLVEPHRSVDELIDGISPLRQRTVLILDNAQSLDQSLVRQLLNCTTESLTVIIIFTEDVITPLHAVSIASSRAVVTLAEAVRSRKKEILPIIQKLDPNVGEGFSDVPLERRIEEATISETPWQFNFVLTGGEQRAKDILAKMRELNCADLLLATIAAGQIASLDEGVSRSWLEQVVQLLGRDDYWLEESLRILQEQRVIFGRSYYRCSHLRFSVYVLQATCARTSDTEWNNIVAMLADIITWESTPLRGISWLLNELRFYDVFAREQKYNAIITPSNWRQIFERCWKANNEQERRDAAFVLDALIDWYPPHRQAISEKARLLVQWIEHAEGNSGFGLGTLLNSLGQGHKDAKHMTETMCEQIDPHVIAAKLSQVKWPEVAGWSHLIGRLRWASSQKWCEKFDQLADVTFIEALVDTMSNADANAFSELLKNMCGFHPEKFLDVFERAIPKLVDALHSNVMEAYREIDESIWYILGYFPGFLRRRAPSSAQHRVAKKLVNALQPLIIAKAISYAPQRDWSTCADVLSFIKETSPKHAVKIANLIDFAQLDETEQGLWKHCPHELLQLILALSILPDHNPANLWIMRHADELGEMNVVLTYVAPQIVVEKLHAGFNLQLTLFWPELTTLALDAIATIDNSLAVSVLESNISKIAEGLAELQPHNCKGVAVLLSYLHSLSTSVFTSIINEVDPEKAMKNWISCLQGNTEAKKAIAMIFAFSQRVEGPITEVIKHLKTKYPSASAYSSTDAE